MTSDPTAPPPEWDDPDETAPIVHDPTAPPGSEATIRRARGATAGSPAEDGDDATIRSRRRGPRPATEGSPDADAGPAGGDGSARASARPDPAGLRTPYAVRAAPVVAAREPDRPRPGAGPPVDSEALGRRIRSRARRRTATLVAASILVLLASAALLVLLVTSGA